MATAFQPNAFQLDAFQIDAERVKSGVERLKQSLAVDYARFFGEKRPVARGADEKLGADEVVVRTLDDGQVLVQDRATYEQHKEIERKLDEVLAAQTERMGKYEMLAPRVEPEPEPEEDQFPYVAMMAMMAMLDDDH